MPPLQTPVDRRMVLHVRRRVPALRGARDMTPLKSEDLTELVEQDGDDFVAMRSPESAEHNPDYRELGRFPTREKAEEFLASTDFS
jgi:hypothetical protein